MNILKKLSIVLFVIMLLSIPTISRAETIKAEVDQTTEYISEETKKNLNEFIQVKEGYEKFIMMEVILLLIAIIAIWKTSAIGTSTKVFAMIAILGLFAYILRFSVEGNIIGVLDITLQVLGILIIVLANFYIYKHDNLLIYVPVYVLGMVYCFNYLIFVKDNGPCKLLLIVAPIALYILGFFKQKADEKIFMKPVEIKHDKKD